MSITNGGPFAAFSEQSGVPLAGGFKGLMPQPDPQSPAMQRKLAKMGGASDIPGQLPSLKDVPAAPAGGFNQHATPAQNMDLIKAMIARARNGGMPQQTADVAPPGQPGNVVIR